MLIQVIFDAFLHQKTKNQSFVTFFVTNLTILVDQSIALKIANSHKNVRLCAITVCAVIDFFMSACICSFSHPLTNAKL